MFSIRFSGKKNDPAKKLGSMYSKHHLFHQELWQKRVAKYLQLHSLKKQR